MEVIVALVLIVLAYFHGRNEASALYKKPATPSVEGELIQHSNGRNCPAFVVLKQHAYPVLWCPFCGAECRDIGEVEEAHRQ